MKKRFTDEQVIGFLRQADAGVPVKELCRQHGFSDASFYTWRAKVGGMTAPDAKRLQELEAENAQRKKRLLFRRFDGDKAHRGTADSLADRFSISRIILVCLDVRLDELRRC